MFSTSYDALPDNTDRYQAFVIEDPIPLSSLLPNNQFYAGSTFCIREMAVFELLVEDASLVGVDKTWYFDRQYLGTYQISVPTGLIDRATGREIYAPTGQDNPYYNGYITHTTLRFERFSYYTIGDSSREPRLYSKSHLDNCNYFTVGAELAIGPITVSGEKMNSNIDIYTGRHYLVPPDLNDPQFQIQLGNISFYIAPGVILATTGYFAGVINSIDNMATIEPEFTCSLVEATCSEQFDSFISDNAGFLFASLEQCELETGQPGNCFPFTWVCPTDEEVTFTYWQLP